MRPNSLAPSKNFRALIFFCLFFGVCYLLLLPSAPRPSAAVRCDPTIPPVDAPVINASAGIASVSLTWSAVACADWYDIYRSDDGAPFFNYVSYSTTSFTDTNVFNGHSYSYYARGKTSGGAYGPAGNTASATVTLNSPSVSAAPGKAQTTVTWGAISGADTYKLSKSQDGGAYSQIASALTVTSYVDSGVSNSHTYSYMVTATNSAGDSPPSSPASATVNLRAPSGLSLARDGSGNVTFSWGSVADADSYILYRSPDAINGSYFGTITGTSQIDTAPYSPITYYYLQAQNAAGVSPVSYMVSTVNKRLELTH